MRKFLILISCLCLSLSCVACTEADAETEDFSHRMKRVYVDVNGETILQNTGEEKIFVDSKTGVMYLFVKNGYGGGLTVMVDENGDPLLWEDIEVSE